MSIKNDLDISSPDFWNNCYHAEDTGWDLGGATPIFTNWCNSLESQKKICVPGCGNGYDVLHFAGKGHSVTAIDFANEPMEALKKESKRNGLNVNIIIQDIFNLVSNFNNKFDYVIEYTCYCAIDPKRRNEYINVLHDLLKPGGELVGIFLPIGKDLNDGGPPFGINLEETIDMFLNKFQLVESIKHPLSISPRADKEQFIRFVK